MVFQSFATRRLAENQDSDEIEFVVLLGAAQTFVRVVAHVTDNEVHGGSAPTFLIRTGLGEAEAEVDEDAGPVDIVGSAGTVVATATCRRTTEEDNDTYLVTIDHGAPSGPWRMRMRNRERDAPRFHGFIAHDEGETRHPWTEIDNGVPLGGRVATTGSFTVRNVGTAPLVIDDLPGARVGPEGSPAVLVAKPASIDPHDTAKVVIGCGPLAEVLGGRTDVFAHRFTTNDPEPVRATVGFTINFPRAFVSACSECATCPEFFRRPDPDEFQCENCFHDAGSHGLPTDPDPFPQ